MTRLLQEVENLYLIAELQEKAEKQYPRLHGKQDGEEYLAAVIDVAAAEIKELRAQVEALTDQANAQKRSENRLSLGPYVLTDKPRATVPRAAYDAQTRECAIKTGVIKRLVRENDTQRLIIEGFYRLSKPVVKRRSHGTGRKSNGSQGRTKTDADRV